MWRKGRRDMRESDTFLNILLCVVVTTLSIIMFYILKIGWNRKKIENGEEKY
jgi:hypothetical protein